MERMAFAPNRRGIAENCHALRWGFSECPSWPEVFVGAAAASGVRLGTKLEWSQLSTRRRPHRTVEEFNGLWVLIVRCLSRSHDNGRMKDQASVAR